MTFLNFIKNSFDRVLSLDTEFRFDETMTIPKNCTDSEIEEFKNKLENQINDCINIAKKEINA